MTVNVNLTVDDYTNRVLGVIKEKFGLRDKGQALVKFAHLFGDDFVEAEVTEEAAKRIMNIHNNHIKKYGFRSMTDKELKKLFDVN
ncbi:MAG: DUF2683 family protein [Candidatus Micrarchaeota archaeon]|nr:DUF2683 family protein [Candidatus Micrarchaeota archaeon]